MTEKMRATMRCQVKGCSLKHNAHGHMEDEKNIIYYSAVTNEYMKNASEEKMKQDELIFYHKYFDGRLEKTNENYIKNRHTERLKSMEEFYDANQPEEVILQIGDKDMHTMDQELLNVVVKYINQLAKWSSDNGNPFSIIGFTLHRDETTPHIHLRRLWHTKDKNNNYEPGYNPALKKLGYERPKLDEKESQANNRKITFDADMRKVWYDVIQESGYDIETKPRPYRKHMSTPEYQEMMKHVQIDVQQAFDKAFVEKIDEQAKKWDEINERLERIKTKEELIEKKEELIEKKDKQVDEMLVEEDRYKAILSDMVKELAPVVPVIMEMAKKGNKQAIDMVKKNNTTGKIIRKVSTGDTDYVSMVNKLADDLYEQQHQTEEEDEWE